jgi:hypothetical protein
LLLFLDLPPEFAVDQTCITVPASFFVEAVFYDLRKTSQQTQGSNRRADAAPAAVAPVAVQHPSGVNIALCRRRGEQGYSCGGILRYLFAVEQHFSKLILGVLISVSASDKMKKSASDKMRFFAGGEEDMLNSFCC